MQITVKEYSKRYGKSERMVRQLLEKGRFLTGAKVNNVWVIDENEPYPAQARFKSGKYVGWREKHPIRNPGRVPHRRPPRPARCVYAVVKPEVEALGGGKFKIEHRPVYVSYDSVAVQKRFEELRKLKPAAQASPMLRQMVAEDRTPIMVGYRLRVEKGADARTAWDAAHESGEAMDSDLIFIWTGNHIWMRVGYEIELIPSRCQ